MAAQSVSDQSSTTKVGCNCIQLTNEALEREGKNTRIVTSWLWDRETGAHRSVVKIQTDVVTKKRGARPLTMLPNYCPFCGTPYPGEVAAQPEPPSDGGAS
jgi:hypothetical protein